jgi:hypothetical protein
VVDGGQQPRLALEPRHVVGLFASASGTILIATCRLRRGSRARYTTPIPPRPSSRSTA